MKIKSIKEIYNVDGSIKNYTSARLNSKFAFNMAELMLKQNYHLLKVLGLLYGHLELI